MDRNSTYFHLNETNSTSALAGDEHPGDREVKYESIMLPLIAGLANLFLFIVYVRFVMIMRRLRRREMARFRSEQEAFDPQGGSRGFLSISSEQTLFESIVEPVFLEADEENLLFELAQTSKSPRQSVEDKNVWGSGMHHALTKVSPEAEDNN